MSDPTPCPICGLSDRLRVAMANDSLEIGWVSCLRCISDDGFVAARAWKALADRLKPMAGNQPQRQDALTDQLRDVMAAARRLGCYDAEDWIRTRLEPMAGTEPEWCPGCADPSVLLCAKCGGGRVVSTPSNELARGDGRMCGRCNAVCDDVTCDCNPDCEWPEPMPSNGSKEGT